MNGGGRPKKGVNRKHASSKPPGNTRAKSFSSPTSLPSDERDPFDRALKLAHAKKFPQVPQGNSLYGGGRKAINSISAQLKSQRREQKQKDESHVVASDDSSSDGGIQLSEGIESSPDDMDTAVANSSNTVDVTMRGGGQSASKASASIFRGRQYIATPTPPPQRTFWGVRMKANSSLAKM